MQPQLYFFLSIAFALVAWSTVAVLYVWPTLRSMARADALQPILTLHAFRFFGLAFLIPGVVSADLPSVFAHAAAFGDLIAAMLALLALASLRSAAAAPIAWVFNVWGSADILDAFYLANHAGLRAGQLGAAYFLPTVIVPLLLVTHALVFRILLRHPR